ncbi:chloride channel protein [Algibacter amylolyticus]|uniref:Chloride channel protein n=1 Tax=Algibacter amylolyticus TaxID=1608400 RepID=A0A5M7BGW3_9FLAO|nr:chloride channel protein [Algibacter amylolyticus]KAA5827688.1 chloride channel protein [Algibacter amylolyticus]MBB5266904.1 CIC family chloride channel protein [Algibacter amylolyticus]TSJ81933.1 chloride channel protein [Algibacter amylolyticus]
MPSLTKKPLRKFLLWKYKYISERQFIYALSILVGFLAGLGTVTLKNLTHYIRLLFKLEFFNNYQNSLYFIFPMIGLFLVYVIKQIWLKKHIGHGISSTLYAISKLNGIIPRYNIYAALITAPLTAGFGGSVGLQGPAVSVGSALGSNAARLFRMNTKTRMLLIGCAAAGAMASMFKAPIAAIIFAIEIFSLDIAFASLVPLLLASVSAVVTSYMFLGTDVLLRFQLTDKFEINDIAFYVLLAVVTGLASVYFSKVFFGITNFFKQFESRAVRLIIGGLAIGTMLYFVPPLYGEGYGIMNNLLKGDHLAAIGTTPFDLDLTNIWIVIALLLGIGIFKAIAMTTTFGAGGVGGVFIPTLVMGNVLGNAFAKIINNMGLDFHVSESNFTLIGMTGLMAGVLHAPLTAIFLIAEITGGYELFVPLMIVSAISFAITKYYVSHSIYTLKLAERGELMTHDKDKNVLMVLDIDKVVETNFIILKPEMKLGDILKNAVAKSSRNHFPVVNDNHEFLGVIRLDDIRHMMFDTELYDKVDAASLLHADAGIINYESDNMNVIMDKFKSSGAWNLPVVKNGKYYGYISRSKLLTAYRQQLINFTQ